MSVVDVASVLQILYRAFRIGNVTWENLTCDLKTVPALTEKNRKGRAERMKKSRLGDEQIHGAVR